MSGQLFKSKPIRLTWMTQERDLPQKQFCEWWYNFSLNWLILKMCWWMLWSGPKQACLKPTVQTYSRKSGDPIPLFTSPTSNVDYNLRLFFWSTLLKSVVYCFWLLQRYILNCCIKCARWGNGNRCIRHCLVMLSELLCGVALTWRPPALD